SMPMPMAGPSEPPAMAMPAARNFMESAVNSLSATSCAPATPVSRKNSAAPMAPAITPRRAMAPEIIESFLPGGSSAPAGTPRFPSPCGLLVTFRRGGVCRAVFSTMTVVASVVRDRGLREDECQHGEDERLDEPHEELETVEDVHQREWHQERHHQQQDLAREDVAKETECERHDAGELGDELQQPHEDIDDAHRVALEQPPEGKELPEVADPERRQAPELHEDEGKDRDRQRRVHIGHHG